MLDFKTENMNEMMFPYESFLSTIFFELECLRIGIHFFYTIC